MSPFERLSLAFDSKALVILAAMSGIIGGEIVLLGMIALPQMLRLGYERNLAIGVVCAGGSLGTMVPPSIVLIICLGARRRVQPDGRHPFVSVLITGISENPTIVLLFMMAILFVLGMFLDWVGIALLTMPIFVPIVTDLGYDPVWFSVLFCMNMQMSFLSPPLGRPPSTASRWRRRKSALASSFARCCPSLRCKHWQSPR